MSIKRYPKEFRIEADKQVTEQSHPVAEVASRIGFSEHSLYEWLKRYRQPSVEHDELQGRAAEIGRLKAEQKWGNEERGILKKAATYIAKESPKVRLH